MADIFVSYAREDYKRVQPIVTELERSGWSIFLDKTILAGADWPSEIKEALDNSHCVLVFWSFTSVDFKKHYWVRAEAEFGRSKEILVPLLLDDVKIPIEFSHIQAADLSCWRKNSFDPGFQQLIGAIQSKILSCPAQTLATVSTHLKFVSLLKGDDKKNFFLKKQLQQVAITVMAVMMLLLGIDRFMLTFSVPQILSPVLRVNRHDKPVIVKPSSEVVESQQKADASRIEAEAKLKTTRKFYESVSIKNVKSDIKTVSRKFVPQFGPPLSPENLNSSGLVETTEPIEPQANSKNVFTVGNEYGGGRIAWIDGTGHHGLIAAKADLSGTYTWESAKQACAAIGDNWHVPNKDELNKLYIAKSVVGDFFDKANYWSSTEGSEDTAWHQYLGNGYQYRNLKANKFRVRSVRAF